MRIAVVKPDNLSSKNAFAYGQHPIFKELNNVEGFQVEYFTYDRLSNFDELQVSFSPINLVKIRTFRMVNIFLKILNTYFKTGFTYPLYFNDFNRYDIIITEGIHYAHISNFIGFNGLLVLNDSISKKLELSKHQRKVLSKLEKQNTVIVCVNELIPEIHRNYGIKFKYYVIGHVVSNIVNFQRKEDESCIKFVSSGRLVEEKGFRVIFKALDLLKKSGVNFVMDIYGDGPLRKELQDYINELGLEDYIFLIPQIGNTSLRARFFEYTIYISHPLEAHHIAEAFHLGNVEAMASSLPVITSDCGGVPFVLKDSAVIVPQGDFVKLFEVIINLINSKNDLILLAKKGYDHVVINYSVETVINKWKKMIYENTSI